MQFWHMFFAHGNFLGTVFFFLEYFPPQIGHSEETSILFCIQTTISLVYGQD